MEYLACMLFVHRIVDPKINLHLFGDCKSPADLNLALLFPHPLCYTGSMLHESILVFDIGFPARGCLGSLCTDRRQGDMSE